MPGRTVDDERMNKGRAWLVSTLAAHPDMIPDLRAYVVYALATTGGAPKDGTRQGVGQPRQAER